MFHYKKALHSIKYYRSIFSSFKDAFKNYLSERNNNKQHNRVYKNLKKNLNCDPKYVIDTYMFIGHNHLEITPHFGAFLKSSHRLLDIYPRIVAVDTDQESLEGIVVALDGSFCPVEPVNYDVYHNQLDSNIKYDSIAIPFSIDKINGDLEAIEKFILQLKSLLKDGGIIIGATTSGLGFKHNKTTYNHIKEQNDKKIWFNLNRNALELESLFQKHFYDATFGIIGSCIVFRLSLPPKKIDTSIYKLDINNLDGKYIQL